MLPDLLTKARTSPPAERARLLEQVSDVFTYGTWTAEQASSAIRELVGMVPLEADRSTLEIILFALLSAYRTDRIDRSAVSLQPVVERLHTLDPILVDYALSLFALTGDGRYRPVIETFLRHAEKSVRESASEALETLSGEGAREGGVEPPPR